MVANPLAGVRGPRAGRTTGRSRLTIANLRSKYPNMVAPPSGVGAGQKTGTAQLAVPTPQEAPVSPMTRPVNPQATNMAALTAQAQQMQTMAGLQAMMTTIQQLQAAQPKPQQGPGRPESAQKGGKPLGPWAHQMGTTPAQNIEIARTLAAKKYGWTGDQWKALLDLGGRESGWNQTAENPSSGAFGIPQALPATKMNQKAQQGLAWPQILWMLKYIKGRYGSPTEAIRWHDTHNWY